MKMNNELEITLTGGFVIFIDCDFFGRGGLV